MYFVYCLYNSILYFVYVGYITLFKQKINFNLPQKSNVDLFLSRKLYFSLTPNQVLSFFQKTILNCNLKLD